MNQEIHFITGKGGVGKSTVAAALALKKSRENKRVLLVELGDQSFYEDYFELEGVGFSPKSIRPNLDVAVWTGESCLREYARHIIKVDALTNLFFENAVMRAFIRVAPGLPELAILGKVTSGPRRHGPPLPYDVIVVDAYATGHFLALLRAPTGMAQAVQFGPMGEQSRSIDRSLRDPSLCHYHIVTLPEELPAKESQELSAALEKEFSIKSKIYINKVLQVNFLENLLALSLPPKGAEAKFIEYLKSQKNHQETIVRGLKSSTQSINEIPFIFESEPWQLVEIISRHME